MFAFLLGAKDNVQERKKLEEFCEESSIITLVRLRINIQGSSSPFRSLHCKIPSGNDFTNPHLVFHLLKWFSITGPFILRCSIVTAEPGDLYVGGFSVFSDLLIIPNYQVKSYIYLLLFYFLFFFLQIYFIKYQIYIVSFFSFAFSLSHDACHRVCMHFLHNSCHHLFVCLDNCYLFIYLFE